MARLPPDIDDLDATALKALVFRLLEEQAASRAENAALREEIRRLKGLNGPPDIKPSGMEKKARGRAGAKAGGSATRKRRGPKKGRGVIEERRVVAIDAPAGSRFKGYEEYLIQDLHCRGHTVLLRRERWLAPDGTCVVAPLPTGVRGISAPSCDVSCWPSTTARKPRWSVLWPCCAISGWISPNVKLCGF